MAFEVYNAGKTEGKKSDVDFNLLNKYVVETAGLQQKETLIGVIAGIIDLGQQKQEDAQVVFSGDEDAEAAEIAKHSNTYFIDGPDPQNPSKIVRLRCWPQKEAQSVTLAIDFPDIMLDKGQFFGDDSGELRPLRMYLGGQFYLPTVGMVVGRVIPLKEKTNTKNQWSLAKNHTLYKMAAGAKLVDASKDEVFKPQQIDQLLGKSLCFEAQIYMKENKGKEYYTESIKYVTGLGRGQKAHDFDFEPMIIQFNQENKEEDLKELRSHVKNTIKQASNYEGSKIQQQLEALYEKGSEEAQSEEATEETKPKATATPKAKPKKIEKEELSNDVPF